MKKKAYLRTIEVAIAVIITFAVAYFIMPRVSIASDDAKLSVLPVLEQKQEFRDCVVQMNYQCVDAYLRNFVPSNYDFTFDITEDYNTPHAGLPDKKISSESIYISGTNNPSAINRDSLVVAYNFDVNVSDGDFVTDLSDSGLDGKVMGAKWVAEGYYGGSYLFSNAASWVIASDKLSPRLNVLPLTMIALIKKSGGGMIMSTYSDPYQGGAYLYVDHNSGRLVSNFNDNTFNSFNRKTGTTVLQNGVWYNVACVIRGRNDMDLYVNGINDGGVYSGPATSMYGGGGIWVGGSNDHFSGQIGPVRVYDRVLSALEVTNINALPTEINLYNPKIIKVYYWRKE